MKAVRAHAAGGPEVLRYEDVPDPQPAAGQVLVRIEAIGMNFAEVGARRNANVTNGPAPIGGEAAGTIVEVGADVTEFHLGDRVAFNAVPGCYAELVAVPAARAVPIPAGVTTKQAAAALLQGMTAHYLACTIWPLDESDSCLVHAAAGGVGLLLCQMARMRGATVIGTVSTEEKALAAQAAGAHHTILYTDLDFVDEVKRLTDGKGVNVVYDSVGQTTFLKGFDCLKPRGMMVSYGQASGAYEPLDLGVLARNGSLFVTRAGLPAYTATREELLWRANDVFGWIASGQLDVHIFKEFALSEAAQAQEALEHRATIGKVLLIP